MGKGGDGVGVNDLEKDNRRREAKPGNRKARERERERNREIARASRAQFRTLPVRPLDVAPTAPGQAALADFSW